MKGHTNPNDLLLLYLGLMKSLEVLDKLLKEEGPMNIGVLPIMAMSSGLAAELMLKFAYECDHGIAYSIRKGTSGHNLNEIYKDQKEERRNAIERCYRSRYEELKCRDVRFLVSTVPPESVELKEYQTVQDVVDNEADVFVRARYIAETSITSEGVINKRGVDTRPYHLWALAKGICDTIDWKLLLRPDNIVITTNQ